MKNTERIAHSILADIRRNVPMGSKDEFTDEEINNKSNRQLFEHWLQWQGIIGWSGTILSAVENIYGIKLEEPK